MRLQIGEEIETRKKRLISNIIMTVLIAAIVITGIAAAFAVKRGGFFSVDAGKSFYVKDVSGTVNIKRQGIGYILEKENYLLLGDKLTSGFGAKAFISLNDSEYVLNEDSSLLITDYDDKPCIEIDRGELFYKSGKRAEHKILFGDEKNILTPGDAVLAVSSRQGSSTVYVFAGSVSVGAADKEYDVNGGKQLSIAGNDISEPDININSLNQFTIDRLLATEEEKLCFSHKEIEELVAERNRGNSSKEGIKDNECTLEIRCDTILNNMDKLTAGKEEFVPESGCILTTSTFEIEEGETVFDILKKACDSSEIPVEYSWTPLYGSYYVEGINNLYELDCGEESGWTYKVDGWFPNYGSSSYKLKGGETIVWCYTCQGLGADLEGAVY